MEKKQNPPFNARWFIPLILIIGVIVFAFVYNAGFGTSDRPNTELIVGKGNLIANYTCLTDGDCSSFGENYYCAQNSCYFYKSENKDDTSNSKADNKKADAGTAKLKQLGFFVDFAAGPVIGLMKNIYYNEGYVGIGTTDPQSDLEVANQGNVELRLNSGLNGNLSNSTLKLMNGVNLGAGFVLKSDSNSNRIYFDCVPYQVNDYDPSILFRTKTGAFSTLKDVIIISHGGNIGIGTSHP